MLMGTKDWFSKTIWIYSKWNLLVVPWWYQQPETSIPRVLSSNQHWEMTAICQFPHHFCPPANFHQSFTLRDCNCDCGYDYDALLILGSDTVNDIYNQEQYPVHDSWHKNICGFMDVRSCPGVDCQLNLPMVLPMLLPCFVASLLRCFVAFVSIDS